MDWKTLDEWPNKVKIMQQNWIGKSFGCEIDFEINWRFTKIKKLNVLQQDQILFLVFHF